MNYEKKYNEALKSMRDLYNKMRYLSSTDALAITVTLENTFPELKESEDEKNIKDLIEELKCSLRAANCQNDACGGGYEKRIALLEWGIAWLEKQGKQKQNFNYHDYVCRDAAIRYLESIKSPHDVAHQHKKEVIDWLNSLEKRIQPQPKQVWSEEDELVLKQAIHVCHQNGYTAVEDWLKSLKPNYWKPSREQMIALRWVLNKVPYNNHKEVISNMVEQLKKL